MHKTSKNQTRYKLGKKQLNQEGTHKSDKQENCPNYIKNPNQHMIEETKKEYIKKENKRK